MAEGTVPSIELVSFPSAQGEYTNQKVLTMLAVLKL